MIMSALEWGWVTALYGVEKEMISPNTQHSTWSKVSSPPTFTSQRDDSAFSPSETNHLKMHRSCLMNVFRPFEDWFISVYEWKMYAGWKARWYGQTKFLQHPATKKKAIIGFPEFIWRIIRKCQSKRSSLCVRRFIENGPDTRDYSLSITPASVITRSR